MLDQCQRKKRLHRTEDSDPVKNHYEDFKLQKIKTYMSLTQVGKLPQIRHLHVKSSRNMRLSFSLFKVTKSFYFIDCKFHILVITSFSFSHLFKKLSHDTHRCSLKKKLFVVDRLFMIFFICRKVITSEAFGFRFCFVLIEVQTKVVD